jgi:hypothetical protein
MPCGVASSVDLDASSHSPVELEIEPRASWGTIGRFSIQQNAMRRPGVFRSIKFISAAVALLYYRNSYS